MKKIIVLLLLCTGFVNLANAQSFGKYLKEHPGVQTYTFRVEFGKDIVHALDIIKSMGFTNIEGGNVKGKTAAEYRAMLDERGIKCTSFGAGYDQINTNTDEIIKNAKTLGAEFIMVAWIPHKGAFDLATAQKAVEDFNSAGKKFKDAGLTLCYHNHGYEFEPYQNGTLFDYIVQKTNPDYVSFEIDILWAHFPGQNPAELINKYPSRFKLMHIKDLKKGVVGNMSGGTPIENDVVVGTGQIDMKAVMKAAQKSSIKYYYIEDESPQPEVQVPQSLVYLKNLK